MHVKRVVASMAILVAWSLAAIAGCKDKSPPEPPASATPPPSAATADGAVASAPPADSTPRIGVRALGAYKEKVDDPGAALVGTWAAYMPDEMFHVLEQRVKQTTPSMDDPQARFEAKIAKRRIENTAVVFDGKTRTTTVGKAKPVVVPYTLYRQLNNAVLITLGDAGSPTRFFFVDHDTVQTSDPDDGDFMLKRRLPDGGLPLGFAQDAAPPPR